MTCVSAAGKKSTAGRVEGSLMPAIVFDGDDDQSYCDPPCDALLYQRRDGSHICSVCCKEYRPTSVTKHRRKLGPSESPNDSEEPLFMHLTDYAMPQHKQPSILDREDRKFVQQGSGRSITSYEEFYPEAQPRKVGKV
jgi:hypothetical protein